MGTCLPVRALTMRLASSVSGGGGVPRCGMSVVVTGVSRREGEAATCRRGSRAAASHGVCMHGVLSPACRHAACSVPTLGGACGRGWLARRTVCLAMLRPWRRPGVRCRPARWWFVRSPHPPYSRLMPAQNAKRADACAPRETSAPAADAAALHDATSSRSSTGRPPAVPRAAGTRRAPPLCSAWPPCMAATAALGGCWRSRGAQPGMAGRRRSTRARVAHQARPPVRRSRSARGRGRRSQRSGDPI